MLENISNLHDMSTQKINFFYVYYLNYNLLEYYVSKSYLSNFNGHRTLDPCYFHTISPSAIFRIMTSRSRVIQRGQP